MLSKTHNGWTGVRIHDFLSEASYLVDIPFEWLKACLNGIKEKMPISLFIDEEGSECFITSYYDELLATLEEPLSFEEAEKMITIFSDDCDDLNWFLLHSIESVTYTEIERHKELIKKCPNKEWRDILETRFNHWLESQ